MIDPGLIATSWTSIGPALGGIATFFILVVLPAAWFFNRKVIKPLSFVLGLKQEDSPTGEQIPSIPIQLSTMRKNQVDFRAAQAAQDHEIAIIKAEVFPNHGGSLRDAVDQGRAETAEVKLQVVNLNSAFQEHLKRGEASAQS